MRRFNNFYRRRNLDFRTISVINQRTIPCKRFCTQLSASPYWRIISMNMPNMFAYTIQGTLSGSSYPNLCFGYGKNATWMKPDNPQDDSYWIVFLDAKNPRVKVKEFVVPGNNNSAIPPGVDTYMNDPDYIFAIATQNLSTLHVPQGNLYDFFTK